MTKRKINNNILEIYDEKNTLLLSVREETENDTLIFTLSGIIQNDTTYELTDEVMAALSICRNSVCNNPTCDRKAYHNFIFDLSGITYISNSALHAFLNFQNVIDELDNAHMALINPSDAVLNQINDTGYDEILDIRIAE
ncbi:MAG: STAS domain-containing protein [Clostridia bacterium]|nr:STAS domain-containing protein [Clostridia bacterium]